jgi:hypothetical protein
VPGRYRCPSGRPLRSGRIEKCPADGPPSRSANTAAEAGPGTHCQHTRASGVTRATARPLASMDSRSIGGATLPYSQLRRSFHSQDRTAATAALSAIRQAASVSPGPTLMPRSGPDSRA